MTVPAGAAVAVPSPWWHRALAAVVGLLLLVALAPACGFGGETQSSAEGTISSPLPSADETGTGRIPPEIPPLRAQPPAAPLPRANPASPALILDAFTMRADPSVTWDPKVKKYRMYTTELWNAHVPMWLADEPTGPWTWAGDALPTTPSWASDDFRLWTPEVANINGVWTLWGSAGVKDSPSLCLYRATGPTAAGPFVPDAGPARWCDVASGGAIDPQMIKDDAGDWWLIFKVNRNVIGLRTGLGSMRIGADGLPTGAVHPLLEADQPWQHDLIESPGFIQDPVTKRWWLTYSGGKFAGETTNYGVAAVPCVGPGGPCFGQFLVPLVATNLQGAGPGEQSVFIDTRGGTWMAYNPIAPFVAPDNRPLALVRIGFDERGIPYVAAPR